MHVKRALAGFHDPTHLQTSPLIALLAAIPHPGETTPAALRNLLRAAVERLRPEADIPLSRAEWCGYRILWMRFVQSRSQFDICDELGLSRSSFYRHQQEALKAVTDVLWQRYGEIQAQPPRQPDTGHRAVSPEDVKAEAIKATSHSMRQPVDLAAVLDGVSRIIASVAAQHHTSVHLPSDRVYPVIYGDPALVRQLFLNVLVEALRFSGAAGLHLSIHVEHDKATFRLAGLDGARIRPDSLTATTGFIVAQALLAAQGDGLRLEQSASGGADLVFSLPVARSRTILVIDDDDDTIALYRRYLQAGGFQVVAAHTSADLRALLARQAPDLVLLDVLMPQEDGWEFLQSLKSNPATATIPVVICSVMDQPGLALTLGAHAVLQKPITQADLLQGVHQVLAQADSRA